MPTTSYQARFTNGQNCKYCIFSLHATRAAVEEGIVSGGGVALLQALPSLGKLKSTNADELTGIQIVSKAIESPLRTIVGNAGGEGSVVVAKVIEGVKFKDGEIQEKVA